MNDATAKLISELDRPENKPDITAAYVWQAASDWRANKDIADTASHYVSPQSITVALAERDTDSIRAAAPLVDNPRVTSQDIHDDDAIVAIHGTYRGVHFTAQVTVPRGDAPALVADLLAAIGGA